MNELAHYATDLPIIIPIIVDHYYYFIGDKTKFPTSNRIGDEDNLRKAINDALQHKSIRIIRDDKMIVGGEQYKLYSDGDHVIIQIWSAKL